MPTMPAAIADRAERWMAHPAAVTGAERLSPGLRRVTFAGAALRGRRWNPGQEIEFRVGPRDFRHYTPVFYDSDAGTLAVVFHTAAPGPGGAWAAALAPGDPAAVMGPGGGLRRRPDPRPVLLGDATTLGLFASLLTTVDAGAVTGAVEVGVEDRAAAAALVPGLEVLTAGAAPGEALRAWADRHAWAPTDGPLLVGHAQTVQALRATVRERGVPRQSIVTKAYWATGRAGL